MAMSEDCIAVKIHDCVFARKATYFIVLLLDAANSPERGKSTRTDVQKNTRTPKFDRDTFVFHLPREGANSTDLDSSPSSKPRLLVTANEVVKKKGIPTVETVGHYTIPLESALERLHGSPPVLRFCQAIELHRKPKESPEPKESPGKLVIDLSVDRPSDYRTLFTVHVHAAINLPLINGTVPSPFALAKTASEQRAKKQARTTTTIAKHLRNVVWQYAMQIDVAQSDVAEEGLFLALIDYSSKKYIGKCMVPTSQLQMSQQYHVGLVLSDGEAYMLISICREPSIVEEKDLFSTKREMLRHEIDLHGFTEDLPKPLSLLAVLQPFDDVDEFLTLATRSLSDPTARGLRIPFSTVYESDQDGLLNLKSSEAKVAYITPLSLRPTWDCSLEFVRHRALLNNPKAAIIVELFRCDAVEEDHSGRRFFFHGYAVLHFSTIAQNLQYGETVELTLPVTTSDAQSRFSISIEMTTWDSAGYLAFLDMKGNRGGAVEPSPNFTAQELSSPVSGIDPLSSAASPFPFDTPAGSFPALSPPSPGLFSLPPAASPATTPLAAPSPIGHEFPLSKLSARRPQGLSVLIPQPPELPQQHTSSSRGSKESPVMPVSPPSPLQINASTADESYCSDGSESAASVRESQGGYSPSASASAIAAAAASPSPASGASAAAPSPGHRRDDLDKIVRDRVKLLHRTKKLEAEVLSLRSMNVQLLAENRQLSQTLTQREEAAGSAFDDIHSLSEEDLARRVATLSQNLQTEIAMRKNLQMRLHEAHEKLARKRVLKKEFLELQQAYKQQSVYVQTLQDENAKIPSFEEATRKQAKVIGRLAAMLRAAVKALKQERTKEGLVTAGAIAAALDDPARGAAIDAEGIQATLDELMVTTKIPTASSAPGGSGLQISSPPGPLPASPSLTRPSRQGSDPGPAASPLGQRRPPSEGKAHPLPVRHTSGSYRKPSGILQPLEREAPKERDTPKS